PFERLTKPARCILRSTALVAQESRQPQNRYGILRVCGSSALELADRLIEPAAHNERLRERILPLPRCRAAAREECAAGTSAQTLADPQRAEEHEREAA